ncbi:type II toxin-antitoxin system mRNA interferase toxin, RelE/StbE family [Cronbergia sp. UHCC 0137]|uniref:type II toxin-antitoxin system RelE family toxin n=1 Tax=Cronbergia sp. UHCC 0137 TaxID=3110239 RepID=UPI002B20338B|nr:type II toxin-antitoxin system mRNA interferase toxin, RelE/StbE family [Cronbergia sp. UHCC 0137]MEA5621132.1 type II toxin-antitoxin system mRNA interferase toxin, RelE/StbE family [Cronbergia sp. UHCC 0137]
MSYYVSFESESITDLDNLDQVVRLRILNKIQWLSVNFEQITPLSLTGQWSGFYKLRVGDYRVIYELDIEELLIIIIRIGHRREIYYTQEVHNLRFYIHIFPLSKSSNCDLEKYRSTFPDSELTSQCLCDHTQQPKNELTKALRSSKKQRLRDRTMENFCRILRDFLF